MPGPSAPDSPGLAPLPAQPLLSVIVPCYNMAGHTRLTVESLLRQSYPRLEVLCVDDGSKDGTLEMLAGFGSRIQVIAQKNQGACRARNAGLFRSRGELVAFLDCDDLWEPRKAQRAVEAFEANPRAGLVYHHALWIDAGGRVVGPPALPSLPSGRIFSRLIEKDFIRNSTPTLRRAALDAVGGWDETIFTTADWELWLRITRRYEAVFLPEALSRTRIASLYNARNIEQTRRETLYIFDKYASELGPRARRSAEAHMHFYLSRLHAANGDYAAARGSAIEAARLDPTLKHRLMARLYGLGRPANEALASAWRAFSRWSSNRFKRIPG